MSSLFLFLPHSSPTDNPTPTLIARKGFREEFCMHTTSQQLVRAYCKPQAVTRSMHTYYQLQSSISTLEYAYQRSYYAYQLVEQIYDECILCTACILLLSRVNTTYESSIHSIIRSYTVYSRVCIICIVALASSTILAGASTSMSHFPHRHGPALFLHSFTVNCYPLSRQTGLDFGSVLRISTDIHIIIEQSHHHD